MSHRRHVLCCLQVYYSNRQALHQAPCGPLIPPFVSWKDMCGSRISKGVNMSTDLFFIFQHVPSSLGQSILEFQYSIGTSASTLPTTFRYMQLGHALLAARLEIACMRLSQIKPLGLPCVLPIIFYLDKCVTSSDGYQRPCERLRARLALKDPIA